MGIPIAVEPWSVGATNMYGGPIAPTSVPVPQSMARDDGGSSREATLQQWGKQRERRMHRWPRCLMDQMLSGSGHYPVRLLDQDWLSADEQNKYQALAQLCADSGNPHELAMDLLSLLVHKIDVRVILDNSGSMALDLFGNAPGNGGDSRNGSGWINEQSRENPSLLRALYKQLANGRDRRDLPLPTSAVSPTHRRWFFARDALRRWRAVFETLGIDPPMYLLNGMVGVRDTKVYSSQLEAVFSQRPGGGTPMAEALLRALGEHQLEAATSGHTLLLIVLTDGEVGEWS